MKKYSVLKIVLCVLLISNASQAEAVWGLSRLWNICTWPYTYFVSQDHAHSSHDVLADGSSSRWSLWNWMPFRQAQQPAEEQQSQQEKEKLIKIYNELKEKCPDNFYTTGRDWSQNTNNRDDIVDIKNGIEFYKDRISKDQFLDIIAQNKWTLEQALEAAQASKLEDDIFLEKIKKSIEKRDKEQDDDGAGIGVYLDWQKKGQPSGSRRIEEDFLETVKTSNWTIEEAQHQAKSLKIEDEFFIGQLPSLIAERDAKRNDHHDDRVEIGLDVQQAHKQEPVIEPVVVIGYEKAPEHRISEYKQLEAVCKKIDTDCPSFKSDLSSDDIRYCDAAIAFYTQQLDQQKADFVRDIRENERWMVSDALGLAQEEGFFDIPDDSFRQEIVAIAGPRIMKVLDDGIELSQKKIKRIQEAGLGANTHTSDKKELSGLTVDELLKRLEQNDKRRSRLRQEAKDVIEECNSGLERLTKAPLQKQPLTLPCNQSLVVQNEQGNALVRVRQPQLIQAKSVSGLLRQVRQSPQLIDTLNRRLLKAGIEGVDVATISPENALSLFKYLQQNPSVMNAIMHNSKKTPLAIEDTDRFERNNKILQDGFKACEANQEKERKMDALYALRNTEYPRYVSSSSMQIKHLSALPKWLQDPSTLSPEELKKRLPYVHALYKNSHNVSELLPDMEKSSQRKLYWTAPFSTYKSSASIDVDGDQFVNISGDSESFKKLLEMHGAGQRKSLFFGDKSRYHLPHYILFVTHGTFARNGKSWHSIDSDTMQAILAFAKTLPGDVEIVPLVWSGGNGDQARTECAQMIRDTVNYFQGQECPARDCKLIYFGHSHAGNGFNEATQQFKKPIHLAVTLCTPVREKQYEPHHAGAEYYIHAYSHGDMIQALGSDEIPSLSVKAVRYSVDKDAVGGRKQQLKQFKGRGFNCNFHYVKKRGDQYTSIAPTHSGVADFVRYGLAGLIRSIQEGHISYDQDLNMGIVINDDGSGSKVYIAPRHQESISGDVSIVEQILSLYAYTKTIKKDNEFRGKTGVSLDGYKPFVMLQLYNEGVAKVFGISKNKPFEEDISSSIIMPSAIVKRHDESPIRLIDDYVMDEKIGSCLPLSSSSSSMLAIEH